MDRIAVETTSIAVLAEGNSPPEVANRRGHLLEQFLAQLLGKLGYEDPRTENLNVTSDGIEIDVVAHARVTRSQLIAECKALSTNVPASALTSFVGKYALARADNEYLSGLFLGLPRLTAEGLEQAHEVEEKFPTFRYLGSAEVCDLLVAAGMVPALSAGPELISDPTIVISPHGLAIAARELDPNTRRAIRLAIWSSHAPIPDPLLTLVEHSELAEGLPVHSVNEGSTSVPASAPAPPTIVAVRGSTSDFEYQLPAAPEFFIGRRAVAWTPPTLTPQAA